MKQKRKITERERTLAKMAVVASSFAYGVEDHLIMKVPRGQERIAMARQTAYWLLRKSGMKYESIAMLMGKKDHATPVYGCRHIESILELDVNDGYAPCIRKAFKHYKSFYRRYEEINMDRRVKELENAF
tara:strand:+ start:2393 stop:2782 length:390 start_codon:yes stop_codon:yes gene_type:complete